ncbi:hypothetical protein AVW11_19210 [Streptomyces amritsarensis]|uniref:Uncharacterized protein n=1 Tax=Streptomyces amritsarensis TaxID=681158 RepID=A0ABX3G039_9ACTN|nr:hypothetical protein AVW11_19210 [Streptomyces amritsarensis]
MASSSRAHPSALWEDDPQAEGALPTSMGAVPEDRETGRRPPGRGGSVCGEKGFGLNSRPA